MGDAGGVPEHRPLPFASWKTLQDWKTGNTMITPIEAIINTPETIMKPNEEILLGVLKFKHMNSGIRGDIIDQLLEQDPAHADTITRNVCARIPLSLSQRLENFTVFLDMNKREIINNALIAYLDQAEALMTEYDAWPETETE